MYSDKAKTCITLLFFVINKLMRKHETCVILKTKRFGRKLIAPFTVFFVISHIEMKKWFISLGRVVLPNCSTTV